MLTALALQIRRKIKGDTKRVSAVVLFVCTRFTLFIVLYLTGFQKKKQQKKQTPTKYDLFFSYKRKSGQIFPFG